MVISFSGDPFLARRAAKRTLAERGFRPSDVTELGEGMTTNDVATLAAQGGLFGQVALLLDFGEAFTGQAGVKPRTEMMATIKTVSDGAFIVVLDQEATPARIKNWREIGEHVESPTPRYEALPRWVATELEASGVTYDKDVPATLAELFGEDVAAIASEIAKLTALDERFTSARVRQLANRVAVHDAFDLIDRIAKGDAAGALSIARQLLSEGEAAQRVLGALVWQFMLVAKALAFATSEDVAGGRAGKRPSPQALSARAAAALKVRPFVAQKALALAEALDEGSLRDALSDLLEADVGSKSGSDPEWALESLVIGLSSRWAKA
ncbi:MAG TPA: DNA polymerase III subunit delta [Trueperaceae bacterium]|nr:DNA polymerase III subunit delta [Trueperaceae bacterium]